MAEERKYKKPVAWLGGRDLLANLKKFLLFASFKGKLDPRDWMHAEVFPFKPTNDRDKAYINEFHNSFSGLLQKGEFWFDYFADAGDGMTAGYAIAYLCMSDLIARLPADWDQLTAVEKRIAISGGKDAAEIRSHLAANHSQSRIARDCEGSIPAWISVQMAARKKPSALIEAIEERTCGVVSIAERNAPDPPGWTKLPRGAFLFVGGDTAYHVADFSGLGLRFQQVFHWAFEDIKARQQLSDEE